MRKKLAKLLRRWADWLDYHDLRPNYRDIKILCERNVCRKTSNNLIWYGKRIEQIEEEQKQDILRELGQYMVINKSVYPTHTLIETRISVLVE